MEHFECAASIETNTN